MKKIIDEERTRRYEEKIELALKRLETIENDFENIDKEIIRLGIYKAFQEIIEVITDIFAMLLIDNKKSAGDDYSNIDKVKEIISFSDGEIEILKEANGLRNRVIHKYNKTDDVIARESIENMLPLLKIIIGKIEDEVNKFKV